MVIQLASARTSAPAEAALAFDAVRQFVVRPDRYYRVELRSETLLFVRSGTQFDLNHTGSAGRHQMKTQQSEPPPARRTLANASKGKLLLAGAGIILGSLLLIVIAWKAGWIVGPFFFAMLFGFVVLMAGIVKPSESKARADDIRMPLARIQSATLRLPQKANAVARLEIEATSEEPFTLTLNTPPISPP